ncbi:DNA repair protein RecO [Brucepastera parasyntrophica]|uniref:DNA repair protein RecO n=1 Tax=Brucepastera parasyntrophica TaxID=2880008 RepID=UPI00210F0724|nr:DNA repair protein RecO [Brucepastera parasyntrophica]ULQ60641.1 DNA repair protein RecO [Brucepastera parasyntrophica]
MIDRIGRINHNTHMANRSWSTEALVLSLSSFGEIHREAILLTKDQGLVRAALFGGAKSRFRSLVSPFHTGTVWLYSNPVKNSTKITDFDVTAYRAGIRENLVRSWCASLAVEIVSRSQGIVDWVLVNSFLDGVAVSDEAECRRALLRFLWRLLVSAGVKPDMEECLRCGENKENEVLYYFPHEDGCLCSNCARPEDRHFRLSPDSCSYLFTVEHSPQRMRGRGQ